MSRALPWCEGPKLEPFEFKTRRIEFVDFLGKGLHSYVFKVLIDEVVYALKTFKFLSPSQYRPVILRGEIFGVDPKTVIHHGDPFYCECRAYGRLKECGREDLAVKSYGYVILQTIEEQLISEKFGISKWDRSITEEKKQTPIRAIVKEFIDSGETLEPRMVPKMMKDLVAINRLGILVWDVREGNYLQGRLVDFSQARTVPHYQLTIGPANYQLKSLDTDAYHDFSEFDTWVIDAWNLEHKVWIWDRFYPNGRYLRHLRKRQRFLERPSGIIAAARYDWKKPRLRENQQRGRDKDIRESSNKASKKEEIEEISTI